MSRRVLIQGGAILNFSFRALQVRWFSFQFVMQQLAEELEDMHTATQLVLAALPKPPKKGRGRALLGHIEPLLPH